MNEMDMQRAMAMAGALRQPQPGQMPPMMQPPQGMPPPQQPPMMPQMPPQMPGGIPGVSGAPVPNAYPATPIPPPILGTRAMAPPEVTDPDMTNDGAPIMIAAKEEVKKAPPPKEDKTRRRKDIEDAIDKAENG